MCRCQQQPPWVRGSSVDAVPFLYHVGAVGHGSEHLGLHTVQSEGGVTRLQGENMHLAVRFGSSRSMPCVTPWPFDCAKLRNCWAMLATSTKWWLSWTSIGYFLEHHGLVTFLNIKPLPQQKNPKALVDHHLAPSSYSSTPPSSWFVMIGIYCCHRFIILMRNQGLIENITITVALS